MSKFRNVEIYELPGGYYPTILGRVYRRIRYGRRFAKNFLIQRGIQACVAEWYRTGNDLKGRLLSTARSLGIPCFALPHGCNVHLNLDMNAAAKEKLKRLGRWADISDMNDCDYYVADSPRNRQWFIDGGIDARKCQAWGSARFCPEWVAKNVEICPPFIPCKDDSGKLKVAFFLPHWVNNVNKAATMQLLRRMAGLPWLFLAIKSHTRGNGEFPQENRREFEAFANVEFDGIAHSPAIVRWADVVINYGSSIGIEALAQYKPLIYPVYLHGNITIYDTTGACFKVQNEEEVIRLLHLAKESKLPPVPEDNRKILYHEVIYGGREPFDVLDYYHSRIQCE